jgi:hypothetical protein
MLGPVSDDSGGTTVHSVDPNVPFVVVTVGGSPAATPTMAVAETIPDSTPLPRIDPPTRDPAAARPASSPGANGGPPAAARAARPPESNRQAGTPVPTARVP